MAQPTPNLTAYIPMDRRLALAQGLLLAEKEQGTALFADISGFTPLTQTLIRELGSKAGAEEVLRQINPLFETLIGLLHQYGGAVIGFAGDSITCWFGPWAGVEPARRAERSPVPWRCKGRWPLLIRCIRQRIPL